MIIRTNNYLLAFLCSLFYFQVSCVKDEDPKKPEINVVVVDGGLKDAYGNPDSSEFNLLFVGNSQTRTNNLPKLVFDYATSKGKKISTKMVASEGYSIAEHIQEGVIQRFISSGQYDIVILQQSASYSQTGKESLVKAGEILGPLCMEKEAKMAYFMVWPSRDLFHRFPDVIDNYTFAAKQNNAILCPVGKSWKSYIDATNDFSYYSFDNVHASLKGSKVAARIIYHSLFGK